MRYLSHGARVIHDKLLFLMSTQGRKDQFTGLILLTARDAPGIAKTLFETLSPFAISIIDIEQIVIHQRLILTVLISLDPAHAGAIEEDLEKCALSLGVDIATLFSDSPASVIDSAGDLDRVIALAKDISPASIAKLTSIFMECGANIEKINRLKSAPYTVLEFSLSGSDSNLLSKTIRESSLTNQITTALIPANSKGYKRKLFVLDVDSTLITCEVIELLAEMAGHGAEVKAITDSAMRGEIDFVESLKSRTALLAGLPMSVIAQVQGKISLSLGAKNLITSLRKDGHAIALVSGGFIDVIAPLIEELKISHFRCNKLEIVDAKLTGKLSGPIIDRAAKASALIEFAKLESISLENTVAIGDGANDLDMLAAAGLAVAFNAKPVVIEAADIILTTPYLDSLLYLLAIPHAI